MNPRNKWNPPGVVPFSNTLVYSTYISGSPNNKPFSTTEMHYPRYQYPAPRNVVNPEDIYRGPSDYQWSGRGTMTSAKAPQTRRSGAARVYRQIEPPNQDAILYHQNMYPPRYSDMWNYHSEMHDTWEPSDF